MNIIKRAVVVAGSLSVLGLAVACSNVMAEPTPASSAASQPAKASQQARFTIEGMTCASCNLAVKAAAEKVKGVSKAGASHSKKTAWAVFDPAQTNAKAIGAAITAAGYAATLVE